MRQTWHDLLFAHWPVEMRLLRARIPGPVEIDLFDGRPWISVVPFRMTNVTARGVPAMPWLSRFAELNVRTYVTVRGKPGVWFFSLDAANSLAVAVARAFFHLPYFTASMTVDRRGESIRYASRRTMPGAPPAELVTAYAPSGPAFTPAPGTIEYFLTERYCLYTVDRRGRLVRLDIHHSPWALQPADADIEINTMAVAAGIQLPAERPVLQFSRRQDMVGWLLARVPV